MKEDKRRLDIPVIPYVLLLLAFCVLMAGGVILVNFPEIPQAGYGTIVAAILLAAMSFLLRPEMFREIFTGKKTLIFLSEFVLIVTVILIGITISHIGFRRNIRYDFTKSAMFSLSDMTINVVRGLESDLRVTAFYTRATPEYQIVEELLQEYDRHSNRFSYQMVDPNRDPLTAEAMGLRSLGTVVVQSGTHRRDILGAEMFEVPLTSPAGTIDRQPKFRGEQYLTSSIINVTSQKRMKVTFVSGHGEASIYGYRSRDLSGVNELLTRENYAIDEVKLISETIPADTTVLVVAAPEKDYSPEVIDKLREYISQSDSHIVFALNPGFRLPNIENFLLQEFGVLPIDDLVVDPRGISQNNWTVLPELQSHSITLPLRERALVTRMFFARSLSVEQRENYDTTEFLKTIEHSWAKRSPSEGRGLEVGFDRDRDTRGPLTLGVTLEQTGVEYPTRAVIFGDSDFFSNSHLGFVGNSDLFINSINWAAGQESMISIRPRILKRPVAIIGDSDSRLILTVCVVGMPLMIFFFGTVVFFYRRRV